MENITSFKVDHTKFGIGLYLSSIMDGDIYTYDVRMKKPNGGDYINPAALHTIEHLFAYFARNSAVKDSVVYVGPMGCRTGMYLVVKGISKEDAINLVRNSLKYVAGFEGKIPGATAEECGNYLEHELMQAKLDVIPLLDMLNNYSVEMLDYFR